MEGSCLPFEAEEPRLEAEGHLTVGSSLSPGSRPSKASAWLFAHSQSACGGVVADDDFAVRRSVDVEFDGIGVSGPSELECRHGILWGVDGFASVRDEFHSVAYHRE